MNTMRTMLAWLAAATLLPCVCLGGKVTVTRDKHRFTMSNGDLTIVIDLRSGGRVSEYRYAGFENKNIIHEVGGRVNGGLFIDHFSSQKWPGELNYARYEGEIVKAGPAVGAVKVWRMSTGVFEGPVNESLTELKVQRTIIMKADSRVLQCHVSVRNTAKTGKRISYWQQNNFSFLPEKRKGNTWYRPAPSGVSVMGEGRPDRWHGYFVEPPIAGWTGVANRKMKRGMMLVMDYNDLWKLYDNIPAATVEWMYDSVAIPAGKAWETDVYVLPTAGMGSFVHGSREIVADMQTVKRGKQLHITHFLTQGLDPLTDVTVKTAVEAGTRLWKAAAPDARIKRLTEKISKVTVTAREVTQLPAVVHVTVTGKTPAGKQVTVRYGHFVPGETGENLDMITMAPLYTFPLPVKKKDYLKPDQIVLKRRDKPHVYFGRGVWYDFSRVDEALKKIPGVVLSDGYYRASDVSNALAPMPAGYSELLRLDVVVLFNSDSRAMGGDVTEEMLADYVEAGGGLLYLAGDLSYHVARHVNKRFKRLLPFELEKKPWGRIKRRARLHVTKGAREILGDLKFDGTAAVYYQHFQQARPGAQVLIRAGDRPILAAWKRGRGRVVASLALPFGKARAGAKAFWETPEWTIAMERALKWLMAR